MQPIKSARIDHWSLCRDPATISTAFLINGFWNPACRRHTLSLHFVFCVLGSWLLGFRCSLSLEKRFEKKENGRRSTFHSYHIHTVVQHGCNTRIYPILHHLFYVSPPCYSDPLSTAAFGFGMMCVLVFACKVPFGKLSGGPGQSKLWPSYSRQGSLSDRSFQVKTSWGE